METPYFDETPPELLARIRSVLPKRLTCDPQDIDDPRISGTPAWHRDQNRQHADKHLPVRYANAQTSLTTLHDWVLHVLADRIGAPSLLITGSTGTGKTHAAFAALRLLTEGAIACRWIATSTAALYGDLRPSGKRDTEAAFATFANAPVLLLDDLGATKNTEWTEEITYRLIDHRYVNCLPSIFTTNVPPKEFAERLGDRTASRLAEMCTRVVLEGTDRRRAAVVGVSQ